MTTARMVFVNEKHESKAFKSFDIPFSLLSKEKFKQPIFGSNYIEGNHTSLLNKYSRKCEATLWTFAWRFDVLPIF